MSRFLISCCLVLLCGTVALAQPPAPTKMVLSPAKPPTPALRYQLLPDARVTITGDAAPIYKEIIDLLEKKLYSQKVRDLDTWGELPLDRLPKEVARKQLAEFADVYERLDKAARCDHCDWGLLERLREKGIAALIPEIQPMRSCAHLLALRARLEMAEDSYDKATVTLRTGFALARHTGESETLISFLVGVAICGVMEAQLEQFVSRPEAPNLYYALTDLPTPLVSMRKGIQGERIMAYGTFPGLSALANDPNAGNLTDKQLADCVKMIGGLNDRPNNYLERILLARNIRNKHEIAKKALIDAGRSREKVEAMPHVQVALLHAMLEYDAALDDLIVWQNLPYAEMTERVKDQLTRVKQDRAKDPNAPAVPLAPLLIPGVNKVSQARARNERRIAVLRVIEAIRIYAAMHDGKLPQALLDIKEVVVPLDPMTGRPFSYQVEGDVATLRGPAPGKEMPHSGNSVTYELRMRK